jgi:hypothetical protein
MSGKTNSHGFFDNITYNQSMSLKIKRWVLTPHAAQRLFDRKISISEIEQIISKPDEILHQGPKYILSKKFNRRNDNNLAAVILEKKGEGLWVVVTVMVNFQKK